MDAGADAAPREKKEKKHKLRSKDQEGKEILERNESADNAPGIDFAAAEKPAASEKVNHLAVEPNGVAADPESGVLRSDLIEDVPGLDKETSQLFVESPALSFAFTDVKYGVKLPRGLPCFKKDPNAPRWKQILKGISGSVQAGESLAILGSSGAGKSTLLDVLARRIKQDSYTGEITVNNDSDLTKYKHLVAYVPQADQLFPMLSVEESLLYSARLRLPRNMPDSEKISRVRDVIKMLGLTKVSNSKIGNDAGIRGISGGERRRTSIGMELVTAPSLLFMDEPTSGLDSFSALNVAHIVRSLCAQNRTVVVTIHQPSSAIFNSFTKCMFLSEGEIVYYGPTRRIMEYFKAIDCPIPPATNPADHILELVNLKVRKNNLSSLLNAYSTTSKKLNLGRDEPLPAKSNTNLINYKEYKKQQPGFFYQLWILSRRTLLNNLRTPDLFGARISTFIVTGIVMGTLFLKAGNKDDVTDARNVLGFFAFAIALAMFTSLSALPVFLDEKDIYKRERGSGYYGLTAYTLSFATVQLPVLFFLALLFSVIGYWLVALVADAGAFFFYVLVMFVSLFAAQSFTMFLSSFVPDMSVGNALGSTIFAFMFLFSGYFIPKSKIPGWWIWFHYLSLFKYPIVAMGLNEFNNGKSGTYHLDNCPANSLFDPACYSSGSDLLHYLKFPTDINKWACVGIMLGFAFFYRVLFYIMLRFVVTPQRK